MACLSRMLQTCYTGGTGRYTKRGDTMTGHALPRIYTAPKQEPADTTHRPSISTHTLVIGYPGGRTPGGRGAAWGMGATMRGLHLHPGGAGRVLGGVGEKWAREYPAKPGGLTGRSHLLSRTARPPWQPWSAWSHPWIRRGSRWSGSLPDRWPLPSCPATVGAYLPARRPRTDPTRRP